MQPASIETTKLSAIRGGRSRLSVRLALGPSDKPPTEFRVFAKGINDTEYGPFLFDETAAKTVMQGYERRGKEVMIDLEHLSTDPNSLHFDPDARGWCELELRNGELWAVNVSWCHDGAERLSQKRQRFISPYFLNEKETDPSSKAKRIVELLNIAICAEPATNHLQPLVAANRRPPAQASALSYGETMDPEQLPAIAEAFGLEPGANLEDVIAAAAGWVKQMQDALSGQGAPPAADEGSPIGDANQDPSSMRVAASRVIGKLARVAKLAASSRPGEKAMSAFRSTVLRETDAATTEEATHTLLGWKASHLALASERAKLAADREALDKADRQKILVDLVVCKAMTPAMAWELDADGVPDGKTPASMFAKMTVAELRKFGESTKAHLKLVPSTEIANADGTPKVPATATPNRVEVEIVTASGQKVKRTVTLTDAEVTRCRKRIPGATEEKVKAALLKYATMKASVEDRSAVKSKAG